MAKSNNVSDLGQHVGYWLRFVSNHVSHAFMQKVEQKGVTVAEWAVLRQLFTQGSSPSPLAPSQLATKMGMTRGAISKLIERLSLKGLVERMAAEEDGRYQSLALTKKGAALVPDLAALADENDHEFFGHLTKREQAELLRMLKGIVQRNGWKDIPVS